MSDQLGGSRLKKFKNSLDSDEDDDEEESTKYNVLNPEDLEGEEEATIECDGEIQITPFNMKEELEEGHFDKEGTYIFHKEENVINDQWLDNIDWVKVKTGVRIKRKRKDSSDSDDLPELDVINHYKQMLEIMLPNETVQAAIRRLGGGKSRTASSRWKKNKGAAVMDGDSSVTDEDYEKLQKLTSLASDLLQSGNMDIYEQFFEQLKFSVDKSENPGIRSGSKFSLAEDFDEALDMFGENFDETTTTAAKHSEHENGSDPAKGYSVSEVMWDFKWENNDSSPVYGPNSTSDMLRWVQEGYFADGVWVRQVGKSDSNFYSSRRIDFELYL